MEAQAFREVMILNVRFSYHFDENILAARGLITDSVDGLGISMALDSLHRNGEVVQLLNSKTAYGDDSAVREVLWRTLALPRQDERRARML